MLAGMFAAIGAHGFSRFAYTVILPSMKEGLKLTYTQMGFLGTGNFAGYLFFATVGGFLAARYGSRVVIALSLLLISISMILTGISQYFEFALLLRILTGVGNGGAYVPAMALGSTWFAAKRRGLATGVVAAGIGVGTLLSGIVVPQILLAYGLEGWRVSWFLLGSAVFAIAVLNYVFVRDRPEQKGLKPVGAEIGASSTGAKPPASGRPEALKWGLVYRAREVWQLGLVYFMYGFSYIIYATFFAAYLTREGGLTSIEAGGLWAIVGALSILSGPISGSLSDLLGRKYGSAIVYLILATSYLIFALVKTSPAFYLSAVLFGVIAWGIPTIMAAFAGDYVGPRLAPAGLGFITLFFGIGQALGPAVGGYIADATGSFTQAFLLSFVMSLVGAAGSLLLKKRAYRG